MVAIARGLMACPTLLMIDEPFLGLAPQVVAQISQVISRLNRERGLTIVFIEQNVELALGLAHRGYVLESGRNILDGPSAALLQSAEVKRPSSLVPRLARPVPSLEPLRGRML